VRWAWTAGGAVAAVLVLAALDAGGRGPRPLAGTWDTNPAAWGRRFPREYDSWRQARQPALVDVGYGPGRTKWGVAARAWREPWALFDGEALGGASEPGTGSSGHPVSCQVCHDPGTMGLRPSQPAFLEALRAQGIDPAKQGAYVCAQCHSARLEGPNEKAEFPLSAAGLMATAEGTGRAGWTHALSGVPLFEIGRPTHELWLQGEHARRGVTCVDCHMPVRAEGTARVVRHSMESPLLDVNASCTSCHSEGEQALRAQAEAIQARTLALRRGAAEALLAAHQALGAARRAGASPQSLEPAQRILRQAQIRWTFIASEPSAGFHAPQEAAVQLGTALDLARQAQLLAGRLAVRGPGADAPGRP
jgi:formate-dependent nitrite reductase cytochrome c552 subunit